jgi:hypothetical protein
MRRLLVNVAVDYANESEAFRQALNDQRALIEAWWSEPEFSGVTIGTLTVRRDVEKMIDVTGIRDLADDHALVSS